MSSPPSPRAGVVVGIVSTKQLAWQVPVVILVIVAIIVGIILIIWNGKRVRRRLITTSIGPEPSLFLSPGRSTISFSDLRTTYTSSRRSLQASQNHMETATSQRGVDTPEPAPVLPRSRPPRPRKPQLGASGPSMPRDVITFPSKTMSWSLVGSWFLVLRAEIEALVNSVSHIRYWTIQKRRGAVDGEIIIKKCGEYIIRVGPRKSTSVGKERKRRHRGRVAFSHPPSITSSVRDREKAPQWKERRRGTGGALRCVLTPALSITMSGVRIIGIGVLRREWTLELVSTVRLHCLTAMSVSRPGPMTLPSSVRRRGEPRRLARTRMTDKKVLGVNHSWDISSCGGSYSQSVDEWEGWGGWANLFGEMVDLRFLVPVKTLRLPLPLLYFSLMACLSFRKFIHAFRATVNHDVSHGYAPPWGY
ncbi:hypothetical protein F5148DRAFT_1151803 [Russula earlei]|uniref:Uncharacterized protein n=1 Tax=Russula earlei TaxID=71964 RepID=A0ACC0TYR6_9AGAM|nr:hypothetical protein F5148DRAFT_1151803 [Russula earlei]